MKNKMSCHSARPAAGIAACRAIYSSFFIFHSSLKRSFLYSSFFLLLLLCSCQGRRTQFTLRIDVARAGGDTVIVYGADEWFDTVDTVAARKGKWTFTFVPDTVTPLWVAFANGHREMVFAERGVTTTLMGDTAMEGCLTIHGGRQNALLEEFRTMLRDTVLTSVEIRHRADTFITEHPYDEVSVWLLQERFVRIENPQVSDIRGLMNKMSGNLQDNPLVVDLKNRLNGQKSSTSGSILSNYNLRDTIGKVLNTNTFRDTCMLMTFWASWNKESRWNQEEYRALVDSFRGRPFVVMGVSLDNDRETWLETVCEDSLTWTQGNGFQGWNLEMLRQLGVTRLPANVLLSPQRKVLFSDLHGEDLYERVSQQVRSEEDRIRALKKAEEQRKKNNKKKGNSRSFK